MNGSIESDGELEEERLRLESVLACQGTLIRKDIADIKQELGPMRSVLNFLAKSASRNTNNPWMNIGLVWAGDLIFRNALFNRGGLITNVITPYLRPPLSLPPPPTP